MCGVWIHRLLGETRGDRRKHMGTAEEWAAHWGVPIVTAEQFTQLRYRPEIRGYVIMSVASLEDAEDAITKQDTMGRNLAGVIPGNPIRIVCVELSSSPRRTSMSQSDVQLLQRGPKPVQ
jgi:hypothetical protein